MSKVEYIPRVAISASFAGYLPSDLYLYFKVETGAGVAMGRKLLTTCLIIGIITSDWFNVLTPSHRDKSYQEGCYYY